VELLVLLGPGSQGESFRLASWLQSEAGQEDRKEGSRAGCGRSFESFADFSSVFPPFSKARVPDN